MGWFGGFVDYALFSVALMMLSYHAWRMARGREVLYHAAQAAFWAAMLVLALPPAPRDWSQDWPFWLALALFALSVALRVWDKRRRGDSSTSPGAESGRS